MGNFKTTFLAFLNGLKNNLNLMKIIIKNYNEHRDIGYFLDVAVQDLVKLHDLYYNLEFLPEMKNIEKVQKLVA